MKSKCKTTLLSLKMESVTLSSNVTTTINTKIKQKYTHKKFKEKLGATFMRQEHEKKSCSAE